MKPVLVNVINLIFGWWKNMGSYNGLSRKLNQIIIYMLIILFQQSTNLFKIN